MVARRNDALWFALLLMICVELAKTASGAVSVWIVTSAVSRTDTTMPLARVVTSAVEKVGRLDATGSSLLQADMPTVANTRRATFEMLWMTPGLP